MKETRPITIFCDIDGTLVKHMPPQEASNRMLIWNYYQEL